MHLNPDPGHAAAAGLQAAVGVRRLEAHDRGRAGRRGHDRGAAVRARHLLVGHEHHLNRLRERQPAAGSSSNASSSATSAPFMSMVPGPLATGPATVNGWLASQPASHTVS